MNKRIGLLKSPYGNISAIIRDEDESLEYWYNEGYVEISEFIEVDFPELEQHQIVKNEIAVIDKKITSIMAESELSINKLKDRKQELLALSYDGE